jgi:hypothetical protein
MLRCPRSSRHAARALFPLCQHCLQSQHQLYIGHSQFVTSCLGHSRSLRPRYCVVEDSFLAPCSWSAAPAFSSSAAPGVCGMSTKTALSPFRSAIIFSLCYETLQSAIALPYCRTTDYLPLVPRRSCLPAQPLVSLYAPSGYALGTPVCCQAPRVGHSQRRRRG